MLKNTASPKNMDKKEYKKKMQALEFKLGILQQTIKEKEIPVIIVLEGWSAAGKGTLIGKFAYTLDPRNFKVHTMARVGEEGYMRPMLWSYWTKTPEKGQIAIFDKSWHRAGFPLGENKWKMSKAARAGFFYDVNAFEKQLTDNGTAIVKFFLHIEKGEQQKRFTELEENPDTSWRIDSDDWKQNKNYDKYLKVFNDMLEKTGNPSSPWHVIEADDMRHATVSAMEKLVIALEEAIAKKEAEKSAPLAESGRMAVNLESILDKADLNKDIEDEKYKKQLNDLQKKVSELGFKLYSKRRSVVIVYEGWDAAGKGGNIKRLTERIDPRGYEVIPVSAPTKEALSHHYLWRFWVNMPKDGHIGIFDRSWYGRVMVERVEKLCGESEWNRAYREINDMELHMHRHGTIVLKFWLHIDKDEQLKRFRDRQNNPHKQHKITDEDWRNRDKWEEHKLAVDEMLARTDTNYAPWHVIESNSKKYARIKVLQIVADALADELEK